MSVPKVSIIIPAYNTEKYIDDMLDCVVNQTYQNIEIIIINDGSTDSTLNHIKKYQEKDHRIICINIPNGGVSNARNIGINLAKGNKFFFWDSDDVIELNTIEECLEYSKKENVNSVLYGYSNRINMINNPQHMSSLKKVYRDKEIRCELMPCFIGHSFNDINQWIQNKKNIRGEKEHTALWRIMLDAKIVKDNNILFDTKLSLGEDTKFINEYLLYENSIGYLDKCFYHLTIRDNSANMTSISNVVLMMENKLKLIEARKELDIKAENIGFELHKCWSGTLVLSTIQLLLRFARDTEAGGYYKCKKYLCNTTVKKAIKEFKPSLGIKGIPFWFIKFKCSFILYLIFKLLPNKVINKYMVI